MWWVEAMCAVTRCIQHFMCIFSLSVELEVMESCIVVLQMEGAKVIVTLLEERHSTHIRLGCE